MNHLKIQYSKMESLKPRHHTILRLINAGMTQREVCRTVGMSEAAMSCFLAGPLAQNELARLRSENERNLVVNEAEVLMTLKRAAKEAVDLNRLIMNTETNDAKLRAKVAAHFMDRVIFDKDDSDNARESFRDILRAVSRIEQKVDGSLVEIEATNVTDVKN